MVGLVQTASLFLSNSFPEIEAKVADFSKKVRHARITYAKILQRSGIHSILLEILVEVAAIFQLSRSFPQPIYHLLILSTVGNYETSTNHYSGSLICF